MDPPYYGDPIKKYLLNLHNYDILNNPHLVICEHFKKAVPPDEVGAFRLARRSGYGDTTLSFYAKKQIFNADSRRSNADFRR